MKDLKINYPDYIGILWYPEPDWHFYQRITATSTNWLLNERFVGTTAKGEQLDVIAAHFGFQRLLLIDDSYQANW